MEDKLIQEINHGILGMRELLYANMIYFKDFINCINEYNKKYKIKLKVRDKINKDERKFCRYYEGYQDKMNIYCVPVIIDYIEE